MQRAIIQPADFAGAALDELKKWLGISRNDEDQQLLGLLQASHEMCEAFTGQIPVETVVEERLASVPGWQKLTSKPVVAVTQIQAISSDGSRTTLDGGIYEVDIDASATGCVRVSETQDARAIAVTALAGIAPEWASIPDALRHGIIRLAAHYYRDRDMEKPLTPPATIAALWRPWRLVRLR